MKISIDIVIPLSGSGGVENILSKVIIYLYESGYQVRLVEMVHEWGSWIDERIPFYALSKEKVDNVFCFIDLYKDMLRKTYIPDIVIAMPWPFMAYSVRISLERLGENKKVISWLHGPVSVYEENDCGGVACLSYADQVWVLNQRSKDEIKANTPLIDVKVIKNPISVEGVKNINPSNTRKLLFIGRLSEEKRLELIVKALLSSEDWSLSIVGDGDSEYKNFICNFVIQNGLNDRVKFLGWKDEPWEDIEDVTALILASSYEALPLVMIEALARGVPVFSTEVDGVTEVIKNSENGYKYKDEEALVELLKGYGSEKYPYIDPEKCKISVQQYDEVTVFGEIDNLIREIYEKN